jgi:hypothetical protein
MIKKSISLRSQEPKQVYCGDTIITTKDFAKEGLKGKVVSTNPGYGIEFDKPFDLGVMCKTHSLKGLLPKETGCYLSRQEFEVVESYKNTDKNKESFVKSINNNFHSNLKNIPMNINILKSENKYRMDDIKSMKRNIISTNKELINNGKEIEKLNKIITNRPQMSSFETQFDRLMKSKKIKDVTIHKEYIIVTTNDLVYKKTSRIPSDFVLGAYKMFINTNNSTIKIINYKKHYRKQYFHPCIRSGGDVCMGDEVRKEVKNYLDKNQIDLLIFLMIGFLEEPNYISPYIDDLSFMCAQPVTIKPRDPLNYIKESYWNRYENWDVEKYEKERKELMDIMRTPNESQEEDPDNNEDDSNNYDDVDAHTID